MERIGYSESDLAARRINKKFIDLLEFEFERTEGYYDIARQSVKSLASRKRGSDDCSGDLPRHPDKHPTQSLRRFQ